jgi:hypothetical protein
MDDRYEVHDLTKEEKDRQEVEQTIDKIWLPAIGLFGFFIAWVSIWIYVLNLPHA